MTTPAQGPRIPPCESCGGQRIGNLGLITQHHVGLHPLNKTLWARPLSGVNAVVCLNCGLVTTYASDLDKLREESQQNPELFSW